ncbi:glutamine synthetase family protein [Marinibaculum pumilum]|uniref:Glutamine synthetase family protein n=1 Tax=Marinibaculum pumilum TaxID=1766165 RepID=A0ABV7KXY7_9PROT
MEEWLRERSVSEVECLIPDLAGIARGKILPAHKLVRAVAEDGLRLPESIFQQTVTGEWVETRTFDATEPDMLLIPDQATLRLVPWYSDPTAQVICDCQRRDGNPVETAPRQVLRRVLDLYEAKGWRPVVAPELEFFLVAKNTDPDYPLQPPPGRSGRAESGRQSYGVDAVNEYDAIFEDMYDYCDAQGLDVDTLIHEAGAAQVEINFNHGDAMDMADQAFLFKRTVRETALRHGVYATFMAKPIEREPGSAMHIHQSVVDASSGENLFADKEGQDTPLFLSHIAGLQRYLPSAMPLLAPNVNSYRRLTRYWAAPINTLWGHENRTTGLRVPYSNGPSRRIENRVPGADANPYLAIAASLACGYLGMVEGRKPSKPHEGNAYAKDYNLPRYLPEAVRLMEASEPLRELFGVDFVDNLCAIRQAEHDAYQQVISAWEREHLLLNV